MAEQPDRATYPPATEEVKDDARGGLGLVRVVGQPGPSVRARDEHSAEGEVTRPIYQIDRAMAEAAIRRSYEQGRSHERKDAKAMVEALALEFSKRPNATAEEFAKTVLHALRRGSHQTRHEGECLGSRRQ